MSTERRAFSLIEIGMGLVLIALIFVPVMEVLRNSVRGTAQSLHLVKAFQAARAAVDVAEGFTYAELTDDALFTAVSTLDLPPDVERIALDPIKQVPASTATAQIDAKVVTVRVAWRRTEGKEERGEVVLHGLVLRAR